MSDDDTQLAVMNSGIVLQAPDPDRLKQLHNEIEELTARLCVRDEQLSVHQRSAEKAKEAAAAHEHRLRELTEQLAKTQLQLTNSIAQIASLRSAKNEADQRVNLAARAGEELSDAVASSTHEKEELQGRLQVVQGALDQSRSNEQTLKEQLQKSQAKRRRLVAEKQHVELQLKRVAAESAEITALYQQQIAGEMSESGSPAEQCSIREDLNGHDWAFQTPGPERRAQNSLRRGDLFGTALRFSSTGGERVSRTEEEYQAVTEERDRLAAENAQLRRTIEDSARRKDTKHLAHSFHRDELHSFVSSEEVPLIVKDHDSPSCRCLLL